MAEHVCSRKYVPSTKGTSHPELYEIGEDGLFLNPPP